MKLTLLILTAALLFAGCGSSETQTSNGRNARELDVPLEDGRTVHCVNVGNGTAQWGSCDWANAE